MNLERVERWAVWTVAVHTLVVTIHAAAHLGLQILTTAADGAFILFAYFVGPVLSAFLFYWRHPAARPVYFLSMLAGFPYGFAYHFLIPGPDNVASISLAGWGPVFIGTTAALAAVEGVGILLGALLLRPPRKAPAPAVGA